MFQNIGEIVVLMWRTLRASPRLWHHRAKVFEQLFDIGNASLLMACVLSAFIGGVLALQMGPALAERGLSGAVGGVIGLSMCKELAPVMMALLIAGRVGSAMAAELGSMRVYQEVDALRTMNINPVHYLVLPRVVAISVALPMLVVFSILVGWAGGAAVAELNDKVSVHWRGYFNSLRESVELGDVLNGLFKSFCFAVATGVISCHQGLSTIGGPRGIGRSVTKAVVNSIVMILIMDYLLTRLLMYFEK